VEVENADIRSAQLLERGVHGDTKRFGIVPGIVDLVSDIVLASLITCGILGRED